MKKFFKPYLIVILIFALTFTFTTGIYAEFEPIRPENVDPALWEYMETANDDELISINICLASVDDETLMEKVKSKTGMDPEVYMDEDRFQSEIAEKVTHILEEKLGYEETHKVGGDDISLSEETVSAIRSAFSNELKGTAVDAESIIKYSNADQSLSIADYTILKIRQNYQIEKNKVIREVQSAANDLFIATYVESRQNTVTYSGRYISSIYLTAKKSDIMFYAQIPEAMSITYNDPTFKLEPSLE